MVSEVEEKEGQGIGLGGVGEVSGPFAVGPLGAVSIGTGPTQTIEHHPPSTEVNVPLTQRDTTSDLLSPSVHCTENPFGLEFGTSGRYFGVH